MRGQQPFMLLRARAQDEHAASFDQWFDTVHLRDVGRIPGVVQTYAGRTRGGTRLGIYLFENALAVQEALQSAEAAYARGTWGNWMPKLEEMRVEIFAPLITMPIYRSLN